MATFYVVNTCKHAMSGCLRTFDVYSLYMITITCVIVYDGGEKLLLRCNTGRNLLATPSSVYPVMLNDAKRSVSHRRRRSNGHARSVHCCLLELTAISTGDVGLAISRAWGYLMVQG